MDVRTNYDNNLFQTYSAAEKKLLYECKQALKSRVFLGYYQERRYEEAISDYRDIIVLQKGEKELEQLLLNVKCKFSMYFANIKRENTWLGITNDAAMVKNVDALQTCIWTNLDNVAFGQYWFSIKTVKFNNKELLIKLKTVRPVETELVRPYRRAIVSTLSKDDFERIDVKTADLSKDASMSDDNSGLIDQTNQRSEEVTILDFIKLFRSWALNMKLSSYNFLAQDVNKNNIVGILKFIGLFIVSVIAVLVVAVKHLGIYFLRLIFEVSRLVHVLTPIAIKLIDLLTKTIGGFYILLSMMWRDVFGKPLASRQNAILPPSTNTYPSIQYRRPILSKNFDYDTRLPSQYSLTVMNLNRKIHIHN